MRPTLFVIKRRVLDGTKAVWVEEPFDLDAFPDLAEDRGAYLAWADHIGDAERDNWRLRALNTYTYDERVKRAKRPEECEETLLDGIWTDVNAHLGTGAWTLAELVQQLGVARFGQRPRLADAFCGAGSIPFEAARIGFDVYASDLNPVACMLTRGAFNIVGADEKTRAKIKTSQKEVATLVDAEITRLGIEHDEHGNRANAYLYCLETRCPKTGWTVKTGLPLSTIRAQTRDKGRITSGLRRNEPTNIIERTTLKIQPAIFPCQFVAPGTISGARWSGS